MSKLEIYNDNSYPRNVLISGAGRSGKTSLCKIWASTKGVDWLEEPISLIALSYTLLIGNGKDTGIDKNTCEALWGLVLKEHINDIVLGRQGLNFRPGDLSSVWEFKNAGEIMNRLYNLKSREDVEEYIQSNNMIFLVDIPEMISSLSELASSKYNSSMITVVREPSSVATDVMNKGWYSDENLLYPKKGNNFTYSYKVDNAYYRLPFWVNEIDADEFIKSSDYARGLIYWISMIEAIRDNAQAVGDVIRYEDLVKTPEKTIEQLCDKYGGVVTDKTLSLCQFIKSRVIKEKYVVDRDSFLSEQMKKRLLDCCGYCEYI